jgi:cyclophilin family peptidyl-prolyl cis-trans isomerase
VKAIDILAATALVAGCPSAPQHPRPIVTDDTPVRIRIAQAEAQRQGGVAELAEIALHGEPAMRRVALRGLGRIGGEQALAILEASLGVDDRDIATTAAAAIGIAGALETIPKDRVTTLGRAVTAALPNIDPRVGYEALGRFGEPSTQAILAAGLHNPATAVEAALALGRHGRRKQPLTAEAREALIAASAADDARLRYAATYALSRESLGGNDGEAAEHDLRAREETALAARVGDSDAETRATAISALAKRGALAGARKAMEEALRDPDWRVAVEAVRALGGDASDDNARDAVATSLVRRYPLIATHPAEAHVVIEGLRVLAKYGGKSLVPVAVGALRDTKGEGIAPITSGWIQCLATAAIERAKQEPDIDVIASCGHEQLPDHLRLPLLADLVTAGAGDVATRRAAMFKLLGHADARVRAAGLGALAATWPDGDHAAIISALAAAIASKEPIVAGAAVDAAPAILDLVETDPDRRAIEASLIVRAKSETEVELSAALYELIGKRLLADGEEACRAGLSGHPVRIKAAAECLRALGEPVATLPVVAPPVPPVDVTAVIGKKLRWHLETTRGPLDIELRPDIAPWSVATIVALTKKGFYDGLEFHRVVPNFVVQGGDPTMSGWGGPGFTTPAEPGSSEDLPYTAGGVGIADSGPDSGGSQWFVMHSRAPHLEGRYTEVGQVIGDKSADALQIGDKVLHATIE